MFPLVMTNVIIATSGAVTAREISYSNGALSDNFWIPSPPNLIGMENNSLSAGEKVLPIILGNNFVTIMSSINFK